MRKDRQRPLFENHMEFDWAQPIFLDRIQGVVKDKDFERTVTDAVKLWFGFIHFEVPPPFTVQIAAGFPEPPRISGYSDARGSRLSGFADVYFEELGAFIEVSEPYIIEA